MAQTTRLVRDDDYEEMASSFQCHQTAVLDGALQEHGISDADVRRKVCESFLFQMGVFHDQGWLKPSPDGGPVFPLLCFTNRFLNTDTQVDGLGDVYAPSEEFSFHEYAFGNAALLYENDPNAVVETGVFEGEEEDT
ncbi:MAG: hypothetical protein HON53_19875 [Planctomycetaceae bacterium]|jgi:hypothetical protein|nr:hypothetical protein [Planctomycetaceae bacterium]MBT6155867.1 hypothetical protein [Planctomycetaceae bacterium]MBT6484253.1 hypothetical protein [Planctomycetaceae bacterium]MBT6493202.1 hypothetical protein [Planctomycetaceae bacterium]